MNKNFKKLLGNFSIFAISNFSTKILNFLILPLYTSFLSTEEYGTIDLATTFIQLLFPVFTLAISDAVMRFGFSNQDKQEQIFKIGMNQIGIGIIPMLLVCISYTFIFDNYLFGLLFFLIYVAESYNTLFANFAKTINKTKAMAIISSSVSTIILGSNVLLVAVLKLGINGYLCSLLFGNCIGIIMYFFMCNLKKYFVKSRSVFDGELKDKMLAYSIPLIPNSIFWWINSSLDRWTLTLFSGISIVGIYAVANKLPTIISNISTVFSQAWNLSLFQSEKNNQKNFFETTYLFYVEVMFCCSIGIIMICKLFAFFCFSGDFFVAWKLVPILTIGVFYNSLNVVLGSLFTSNKDTKLIFTTTFIGSIINCVLNIPMVFAWNIYGAAIATTFSYMAVFIIRTYKIWSMYGIEPGILGFVFKAIFILGLTILALSDTVWMIVYSFTIVYYFYFIIRTIKMVKPNRQNTA